MSDVLERIDEKVVTKYTDGSDAQKFQHYFTKAAIERNLLDGIPMRAICGQKILQQRDPKGLPICEACQYLYDNVVQDA